MKEARLLVYLYASARKNAAQRKAALSISSPSKSRSNYKGTLKVNGNSLLTTVSCSMDGIIGGQKIFIVVIRIRHNYLRKEDFRPFYPLITTTMPL